MNKIFLLLGVLISLAAIGSSTGELTENLDITFVTKEELKELMKQYPNAVELQSKVVVQPEDKNIENKDSPTPRNILIYYHLGERLPCDDRIQYSKQNNNWSAPRDVELTVQYPQGGGSGNYISLIGINVEQTALGGGAYLLSGGPGRRTAHIVVAADNTYVFNYEINFYGFP